MEPKAIRRKRLAEARTKQGRNSRLDHIALRPTWDVKMSKVGRPNHLASLVLSGKIVPLNQRKDVNGTIFAKYCTCCV